VIDTPRKIAILGGTGPQGSGLAIRCARAGYTVLLGSRDEVKSKTVAGELNAKLGAHTIEGVSNVRAAEQGDVVILTVPYAAQQQTALEVAKYLHGKILVDVTVPLMPPKVGVVQLPPKGSAALALQQSLPSARVVSAFQNLSAQHLHDLEHGIDCEVLVCGDDEDACQFAVTLAGQIGTRGWRAGPLANAAAAEALTSVLITLNRRYKIPGSGIRITGVPGKPAP
jgi:NADPH-dependent F420 reductase